MNHHDLLIEIGTEELPPKALASLGAALAQELVQAVDTAQLAHGAVRWFATPRRLAVLIAQLDPAQGDRAVEKRGPAYAAAFDKQGKPTRAAEAFAASCGVAVDALITIETDKGKWVGARYMEKGKSLAELLPAMLEDAVKRLPIPRRMRWGAGDAQFARPVHWLVLLHGGDVIPAELLGVRSGRGTRGHRFLYRQPIELATPAEYEKQLREPGHVIADFAARRARIAELVETAAAAAGGRAQADADLLDEVAALVEWPAAVTGSFDDRFLELPRELLVTTMQHHQRYFPLLHKDRDELLPQFVAITNIDSANVDGIRRGNERVIRPRLADAEFFWRRDARATLASREALLAGVVFQAKLGTLADKTVRVRHIARELAARLGADAASCDRASQLAKCDLLTELVGEFPELQGIAGRYYAARDGEPAEVAQAVDEQYLPRFAGDRLPRTATGRVLSIADRLDTLAGIFAIGQAPTGEKDPFGLRRAALGCLRVIIECGLELDLEGALTSAATAHAGANGVPPVPVPQVFEFMLERLRRYYLDTGTSTEIFEAVLARRPTRPLDFHRRLAAVAEFSKLPDAASLAAANKRIRNILRQAGVSETGTVDAALLREDAERQLATELEQTRAAIEPLLRDSDYTGALKKLAALRGAVDLFFDQVLVNCEDQAVRANRLALLGQLSAAFLRIADISVLQVN
jgi:glycyl-tRNA synthetase beta chain